MSKNIYVTQPSLAPLVEYNELLKECWESGIITHNGPLVQKLEKEIKTKFYIKNIVAVTNGTIALQLALRSLDIIEGEVITTPFSWIATCSAITWERCRPIFVDIDPETFNLDPNKVEEAITSKTKAIMPVHVFSNPCDIEAFNIIANKYKLSVIYDAAHAFGVTYKGKSILENGDVTATSFHATKIFNSGEGGACISINDNLHKRLSRLRFFGHDDSKEIVDHGLNAKMTEIHAALGIVNLRYLNQVIEHRRNIYETYYSSLSQCEKLSWQKFSSDSYNFSYMPIVFDSEERLVRIENILNKNNIFPRRYFYPSLNTISTIKSDNKMPISEKLASRILCLPTYTDLDLNDVSRIGKIIFNNL